MVVWKVKEYQILDRSNLFLHAMQRIDRFLHLVPQQGPIKREKNSLWFDLFSWIDDESGDEWLKI